MDFELLWKELSEIEEVEAIALGGSRATNTYDDKSDYDLYVYCSNRIDIEVRKSILSKYCKYMEISNTFWEEEDDCTLNNGIDIDIIYRNLNDFDKSLDYVVNKFNSYNGYTTCMWFNLLNSKILYDKDLKLTSLKNKYDIPYPKQLRENIISNNLRLLHGNLPSYDKQIIKAVERDDKVSINHRLSAFLEAYFDILFAYNVLCHPGEKRMVSYLNTYAYRLPEHFEEYLNQLFKDAFINPNQLTNDIELILFELDKMLNT